MSPDALTRLEQAVRRRDVAMADLVRAVKQAHAEQVPIAEIARTVGVSRPTVYKMLGGTS